MIDLKQLHQELIIEIPDYEFEYKNKGFRERIVVKKDTFRGAEIYELNNHLHVIPTVLTFRGRLLFGAGIGFAPAVIKNFEQVALTVEAHLAARSDDYKTTYIEEPTAIPLTKKQRKLDAYVLTIFGFISLVFGIYLFTDSTDFDKYQIEVFLLVGIGGYMLFDGIKRFKKL
ncbi:MAG: hypothetical protein AB8G11_09915 [Saprospiraceae bacterium]